MKSNCAGEPRRQQQSSGDMIIQEAVTDKLEAFIRAKNTAERYLEEAG